MATITSIGSGKWSNPAIWDAGVPADGDSVVIASGHVVTFDYDMSAWVTGIDGLTITGTLNFETAAGIYHLMMKAATTINGAGTMNVGTETAPIPFAAKHTITGGDGWYIQGSGGLTMTVYGAEPTYTHIKLSADEAAGQTILSVDTNVMGDIWADGDTIRIDDINQAKDSEERTIAAGGIAAGEITITAGLTAAKLTGAIVSLITRNVKFIGVGASGYVAQNFTSENLTVDSGQWTTANYRVFNNCTDIVISGGTFSGNNSVLYSCSAPSVSGGIFSGNTYGLFFSNNSSVSGGIFSGNAYGLYNCGGISISGATFIRNSNGLQLSTSIVILSAIFTENVSAIRESSVFEIKGATFTSNTYDMRESVFSGYNIALTSSPENITYSAYPKEIYSYIIDNGEVQGAYKAWTKGGVTTLQSTVYPTGLTESYNIVLEDADNEGYFQKELVVGAGQSVNFDLYLRKDGAMSYLPRIQLFLKKETDPFAGGTPEHTFTMTNSVDTWESETYTYSNDGTEDETIVIRCLGKAASGNVYGMYDAEILNMDLTDVIVRLTTIDGIVDDILVDTGTDIPASITTVQADLDNPNQYKADVSALALEATLTAIKGAGWTDEDLVAIKAAVDSVKTWTAANISSSVTSGAITQIRGNTWDFEIPDLTLDSNLIQLAIKETKLDADAQALLLIDTATGLLYVNGAAASDATKASLSYVGTTLTVTVDASITAQLPTGNHHYGIQSVTAAGVVSESYGGTFTITADTVRATE